MNITALRTASARPGLGARGFGLAGIAAASLFCGSARAQTPTQLEDVKLVASDAAAGDFFGNSVAIDGDVAIVGADRVDEFGVDAGAAYVFRFDGVLWNEEAKLSPSDVAAGDFFGRRVALHGDVAVVPSLHHDDSFTDSGAVYVFRYDGVGWVEEQKLVAPDPGTGDQFGNAVAVRDDVLVIGSRFDDTDVSTSGSTFVFRFDGANWNFEQKLQASDRAFGDRFGEEVTIDGTAIAIGARDDDDGGSNSGSVYVFRDGGVSWSQEAKLTASDAGAGDLFGEAVDMRGDVLLVGATLSDAAGSNAGSAYVFRYDGMAWSEEAQLLASDAGGGDRFGRAVATCADVAIIGAFRDDDLGTNAGAAYVFRFDGMTWVEEVKLHTSDGANGDRIGGAVAISGSAVIGARSEDDGGSNAGAAYVYEITAAPVALAGLDQSIHAGDTVLLDGTSSFDDDTASAALGYSWAFVSTPAGSTASIAGADSANASFVADLPGSFVVQLEVQDACGLLGSDEVVISSNNVAPTADAGPDTLVLLGDPVLLDGADSNDPDGDSLTYSWSIVAAPAGSTAQIANPTTVTPSLTPDLEGVYVISLQVSDPFGPGTSDSMEVTATTAEDFAETQILEASADIGALPPTDVTTTGNQTAMGNYLGQACQAIQKGDAQKAIRKIEDALERCDGVALRGAPDGNGRGMDWITDPTAQLEVYNALLAARDALQS